MRTGCTLREKMAEGKGRSVFDCG